MANNTEEKIIEQLHAGNEEGLTLLSESYGKLIRYVIAGILGKRKNDIEECLNDTYLKDWNSMDKFDVTRSSLKSYVVVIARNTALTRLTSIKKHENNMLDQELNDFAQEHIDYCADIEQNYLQKEQMMEIKQIIMHLKGKERELILRRYFYMQTSEYIASKMGCSKSAVDNRLNRLRRKIQKKYTDYLKSGSTERRKHI